MHAVALASGALNLTGRQLIENVLNLDDVFDAIVESDAFIGLAAETNALAFQVDDYEIVGLTVVPKQSAKLTLQWCASGDQDEDRPFCGTELKGTADVLLYTDGTFKVEDVQGQVSDL